MFGGQLVLGTVMVVATVMVHAVGLVYLVRVVKGVAQTLERRPRLVKSTSVLIISLLSVLLIHTLEVWAWAALYLHLGEFAVLERALYFSAVTATTLGYGDITLSPRWQLLSTFEAIGGLILFGVTTAFLLAVMRNIFEELSDSET